MSYCFDVMAKAWAKLEAQLPEEVKNSEAALRFGFLIEEMHEANHRLRDAINHDARVTKTARKLDEVITVQEPSWPSREAPGIKG